MPELSILIPHKHEPENDKALKIALNCIVDNTRHDYEILVDSTTPGDPYVILNQMVEKAASEWVFFSNSDIFVSPNWDVPLMEHAGRNRMVTATLVECGAIGVHDQNLERNFGKSPDTFRRADFEAYAASNPEPPKGMGFYYYLLMHKQDFIDFGKFETSKAGFPYPLDSELWDRWLAAGKQIIRARSYVYHLQCWTNRTRADANRSE